MDDRDEVIKALLAENVLLKDSVLGWAKAVDESNNYHHGESFTDSFESAQEELSSLAPKTNELLKKVQEEGLLAYASFLKENGMVSEAEKVLNYISPAKKKKKL